jgi:hypothetical protein
MTSIDQVRADVQRATRELMEIADCGVPATAATVERSLWTALLSLGQRLMVLYFARQAERWATRSYLRDGDEYVIVGCEDTAIGTRFGRIVVAQPVGRRVGYALAARDLPLQRALGLPAGFTVLVVATAARLCAQMAFASARDLMRHLFEWSPSPRAVLRMVDAVGERARPFLEGAEPPEGDGEVLVITVDGKGAPTSTALA